jgi:hypothetical protein
VWVSVLTVSHWRYFRIENRCALTRCGRFSRMKEFGSFGANLLMCGVGLAVGRQPSKLI